MDSKGMQKVFDIVEGEKRAKKAKPVPVEVVYKYIVEYQKKYLFPPTLREISDALMINSISTVHAKIRILSKKGWIHQDVNGKITLTGFHLNEGNDIPADARRALENVELKMVDRQI